MPNDRRLTKLQRNEVFKVVEHLKFEPVSFKWESVKTLENWLDNVVSRRLYQPTGHFFLFDYSEGQHGQALSLQWWPDHEGGRAKQRVPSWLEARGVVNKWLKALRSEVDAPDLWATAEAERVLLLTNPDDNSQFSPSERELVTQHLRTIEQYVVKTHELTETQHAEVRSRLAYLDAATERLGRFDWKGLAASTFISIVLQLGLTPDKAAGLMNLAGQLLGPLLSSAMKLLGGV
jgi:hypothetical protein